jgi:hypothetical protein
MSTTTVGDLLERAEGLARGLRATSAAITRDQWDCFDSATYRLLHQLVGPERVGDREQILSHVAVVRLLNGYPSPLTAPSPEATYNARQAASHLGVSRSAVAAEIRRSHLPATNDRGRYRIKATDLPCASQVQPADPASTHPLDRVSCTLGALADMVVAERSRTTTIPGFDPLRDDAQVAPVIARIFAVAIVAARHTLTTIPLQDADRPLLIARYAEHGLDALGDIDRPSTLTQVVSFLPPSVPHGPNEELEAALRGWASHARMELARTIPSTEVLRDIANQARHLYALSAALTSASFTAERVSEDAARTVHGELRQAAEVMYALAQQWAMVTTATRPGHEYVAATTALHASLTAIARESLLPGDQTDAAKRIDVDQALADLRHAATDLVELTYTGAQLPEPLIRSDLLFAPARVLPSTMERMHDRTHGKYVPIQLKEGGVLIEAAQQGSNAARNARATLEVSVRPVTTELSTQPRAGGFSHPELRPATGLDGLSLL